MSDLLLRSEQSLIMQSFRSRERQEPLNGDGFGVGWYAHEADPIPCVFTSTTPAWSNRNLHRLAEKIRSSCFFAHVRAATQGFLVNEANCHPFQCRQFLWMHNGNIPDFDKIKRRLRESLDDEYYNFIQGTTDSEHVFALFLNKLKAHAGDNSINTLKQTLVDTLHQLDRWRQEAGIEGCCNFNFALSDGNSIVASRYTTAADMEPPTLYISLGDRFESYEGRYRMLSAGKHPAAAIIASEPLTEERADWQLIPKNHLLAITPEFHVHIEPIH
jgi:predicted glutamine amidotransferase